MQSADRALRILSSFGGRRVSLGVTEVAQELGIHKSTVSRLMAALEQRGFVRREGERFVPGLELARLARTADPVTPLVDRALPVMERLASITGEAVTLGVPHGSQVDYVAQRDGGHIVGVADWTNRSTAIHASASGKVLLAFAGVPVPETLERHTPRTIVDPGALEREVDRTQLRGYAQMRDELEVGLTAVAAPVFDRTGACVAALGLSGPTFRLARLLAPLGERCRQAADDVTAALSGGATDDRGRLTSKTSGAHA